MMKPLGPISCVTGVLLLQAGAFPPDAADPPFHVIAVRNVFGLRAAPLPAPAPETPKPPPPRVFLTGTTARLDVPGTTLHKKRAFLETTLPVQPPAQPKKTYFMLGEGEREGELEVLKIDEVAGSVEIRILGVAMKLTLADDGIKPSNQPAPPVTMGPPGQRRPATPPQALESQFQLDHEEAALVIEMERLRLKQKGDPIANTLPVTALTPAGTQPATSASETDLVGNNPAMPATTAVPRYRRPPPPAWQQ